MNLYPISSLFFYRLIFMFWLLFGEGLFLFKLKKKKHFVVRTILSYLSCFAFALAFPIPTGNAFYLMFMFFAMFLFTFGMTFFRYSMNWNTLFFLIRLSKSSAIDFAVAESETVNSTQKGIPF